MEPLNLWAEVAAIPDVKDAWFSSEGSVTVHTSVKDVLLEQNRDFHTHYSPERKSPVVSQVDVVAYVPSPSGKRVFCLRKYESKKAKAAAAADEATYSAEIINADGRPIVALSTAGIHGKAFAGGTFGGVSWRSDEEAVAYVAEPSEKASGDDKADKSEGKSDNAASPTSAATTAATGTANETPSSGTSKKEKPGEFEWRPDWGEQLVGIRSPRVYVLLAREKALVMLPGVPDNLTASQVQWAPDGQGVVFVGYANTVDRAGIIYYNSRASKLYWLEVRAEDLKKKDKDKDKDKEKDKQRKEEKEKEKDKPVVPPYKLVVLTPNDHSPVSPRFSPDGRQLAWLTTDEVLVHRSGQKLRVMEWRSGDQLATAGSRIRTVVDIVQHPSTVNAFPGIWSVSGLLPARGGLWLHDGRHVVLSSCFRSAEHLLVVDTQSGAVTLVPPPFSKQPSASPTEQETHKLSSTPPSLSLPSVAVLDVDPRGNRALASVSSLNVPPAVYQVDFVFGTPETPGQSSLRSYKWTRVSPHPASLDSEVARRMSSFSWEVIQVDPGLPCRFVKEALLSTSMLPFEAVLLLPNRTPAAKSPTNTGSAAQADEKKHPTATESGLPPLVLFPHGGPHSNFTTGFLWGSATLAAAGFAVLHVNYRGSSGFGQGPLESLPGLCGRQDVHDCMRSLEAVTSHQPACVAADRVSLFGGSHGGFLVTHLIGQYPTLWTSCVARNPVTNVAHMVATTDIADWCYVECGLASARDKSASAAASFYTAIPQPSAEHYTRMLEASPIRYVSAVQTPLMLMLGSGDRRVPMSQALDYLRFVASRNIKTRTLVYPNSPHSLADTVTVENSVWQNALVWLSGRFDDKDFKTLF